MTPTLYVARLDGHGQHYLSLHTSRAGAVRALREASLRAWSRRFSYGPDALRGQDLTAIVDAMEAEGWVASVVEQPVDLDGDAGLAEAVAYQP